MVLVYAEEVIEVASHILGRYHQRCKVKLVLVFWEGWKDAWQNGMLYFAGYCQVSLQRFQLRVLLLRLFDIGYLLSSFFDGYTQVVKVDGFRSEVESTIVHCLSDVAHVTIG